MGPSDGIEQATYEQCLELLGADINGLSDAEAEARLAQYGPNQLKEKKERNPLIIFLKQFKSAFVYILVIAAIISLIAKQSLTEFFVIISILIINAVIGFIQEWKAERTIRSIHALIEDKAMVVRGGEEVELSVEKIVPGDILLLAAGKKVPADTRVLFERNLHVDESLLTGESVPIKKEVFCLAKKPHFYEQLNMVFAGSYVTEGRGRGLVISTGNTTLLGKIHKKLTEIKEKSTPMAIRIKQLSLFFVIFALTFFGLTLVAGLYRGIPGNDLLFLALASLVSAIPEGLIVVITIVISIGIYRLAQKNVIVRNLGIIETLGITNIICSDKTGTLTKNEMMVRRIYTPDNMYEASGTGYDVDSGGIFLAGYGPECYLHSPNFCYLPDNEPQHAHEPIKGDRLKEFPDLENLLIFMGLCNDAEVFSESYNPKTWHIKGSPTEAALLVALEKVGLQQFLLEEKWLRISEIPFSSKRKFMATLHEPGSTLPENETHKVEIRDKNLLIVKGAPEKLKEFAVEMPLKCQSVIDEFTAQGLRVLGCAIKYMPSTARQVTEEELKGIQFLGLVGISDPPREGVANYVKKCNQAGISVRMVTGDNQLTAKAIAQEVGIFNAATGDLALNGDDLEEIPDAELVQTINKKVKVFSRTDPIHKLRIVKAFQASGAIVAMTGDGVNDSPALKQADIGIAMGITGTDIAKEAADVVLKDEKFEAIVDGIDEGRNIFNSFRRVVLYLFSTSLGQGLFIVCSLFLPFFVTTFLVLLPLQILWINLVTSGFLDAGVAMEPKEEGLLEKSPGSLKQQILSRGIIKLGIFYAAIMVVGTSLVYLILTSLGCTNPQIRTGIFLSLIIFQWFNTFNCRSPNKSVFTIGFFKNRLLLIFLLINIFLVAILFIFPALTNTFDIAPLGILELLIIVGIASTIWLLDEVRKRYRLLFIRD